MSFWRRIFDPFRRCDACGHPRLSHGWISRMCDDCLCSWFEERDTVTEEGERG